MRLLKHFTANNEKLARFPFKRELSMESYLIENESVLALDDDIFCDVSIIQDELTLKDGRSSINTDGRIDLLVSYSNEYIGVVELKIGELNRLHLTQLKDYLRAKDKIIEKCGDAIGAALSANPKWVGVLVGSSIDADLARDISNGLVDEVSGVPIAALIINRFTGDSGAIYVTTDVIFKNNNAKDYTKYNFLGETYGKGRLVLAVLKEFVEKKPCITFSDLKSVFNDGLQGKSGVFDIHENAEEIYNNSSRRRHFLKPDELITLGDCVIAVSNQWGSGNIGDFIKKAKELEFTIEATN